jgi:capsular exopolysaccharide synthesis family protein
VSTTIYPPTGAAPQPGSGFPQFNLHTVLIALRCWWHLAMPMGLLLAAGAAVIVYYISVPTYTAEAHLEIRPKGTLLSNLTRDGADKFVANQLQLLRSPPVLEPVIAIQQVGSTPELLEEEDKVGYLRNNLKIQSQAGSDYFVIKFTSRDPAKAALIVNEVVNSYVDFQDRHESRVGEVTIELLQEQLRNQQAEVGRLRKVVEELSKQATGQPPIFRLDEVTRERPSESRSMRSHFEMQLEQAKLNVVQLKVEIEAQNQVNQEQSYTPPPEIIESAVENDPKVVAIKTRLAQNRDKLDQYRKAAKEPEKNVEYQRLLRTIEADEAELGSDKAKLKPLLAEDMENFARAKSVALIEELQVKLVKAVKSVEHYENHLKSQQEEQKRERGDTLQLEFAWADYHRASDFLEAISNRIMGLKVEQRAPVGIDLLQGARVPVRADEEIPLKKMLMAALAAMVVPFGLAVGTEMLFGRVSSRRQLESIGQLSVVGEIANLPRRAPKRLGDNSRSKDVQLFEESINGLRTYLTLVEATRGRKVLAVTSSISREGKTSLAAQLAVSVAGSTGKPTLLIDGDMRSPDIHRIFEVDCGPGLSEVLAGTCRLEDAIETDFSERLHLITAGHLTVSPHQLVASGGFSELIEKLRGMYEHIIIDTPPILPASEALVMARAADAAILCVRRDYSRFDQVTETHNRLVASGVRVAGAVLSGVPTQHYAYRYGSYYYTTRKAEPEAPAIEETNSAV